MRFCACGHPPAAHDNGCGACGWQACNCLYFKMSAPGDEKSRECPSGHRTGVKDLGGGNYFCVLCAKRWSEV